MKLLTEVHNCPGTLALASFLVAFLEGVAFCLPHFCGPINNWAYGTADGLCPIPGTVTSKCDHRFLHFSMNLVTCSTCKATNMYPSSDQGSMVEIFKGEHSHKKVLQKIVSYLHPVLISDISLTEMFLFWHWICTLCTVLPFFHVLPSACRLHEFVPFSQPGLSRVLLCIQMLLLLCQNNGIFFFKKLSQVSIYTCFEFWSVCPGRLLSLMIFVHIKS